MIYCVYDQGTGIIRARFDTAEVEAPKQVGEGEALFEGDADPSLHFIDPATGERRDRDPQVSTVEHNQLVKVQIAQLEQRLHRPTRELVRNPDDAQARRVFDTLEAELLDLRGQLK